MTIHNTEGTRLYIIATPIGNLEDITLRALRLLKESNYILCEDTRTTKKLLSHYNISTKTLAFHTHSSASSIDHIITLLREGNTCALVTDAGTPGISDPASVLINKVRNELSHVVIEPIPGPSALTAALSVSGISHSDFIFLGFLPHKKGRETLFKEIATSHRPIVFYESPHRIKKTFTSLTEHVPQHTVIVLRELTKIFEEYISGTPASVLAYFTEHQEKVRGEFVVIVVPH